MSRHLLADCIRIEMPILYVPFLTSGLYPHRNAYPICPVTY